MIPDPVPYLASRRVQLTLTALGRIAVHHVGCPGGRACWCPVIYAEALALVASEHKPGGPSTRLRCLGCGHIWPCATWGHVEHAARPVTPKPST